MPSKLDSQLLPAQLFYLDCFIPSVLQAASSRFSRALAGRSIVHALVYDTSVLKLAHRP